MRRISGKFRRFAPDLVGVRKCNIVNASVVVLRLANSASLDGESRLAQGAISASRRAELESVHSGENSKVETEVAVQATSAFHEFNIYFFGIPSDSIVNSLHQLYRLEYRTCFILRVRFYRSSIRMYWLGFNKRIYLICLVLKLRNRHTS